MSTNLIPADAVNAADAAGVVHVRDCGVNRLAQSHPLVRWARWLAVLLAGLTVGLGSTLTPSNGVSAWTTSATRSPGSAQVPVNLVYRNANGPYVVMPQRVVTESPGYRAHDQYVCATYRLFRLAVPGSGWLHVASKQSCGWIRGAQSQIVFAGATFGVLPFLGHGVDVNYTWKLANGTVIGTRNVDSAHRGDYSCQVGNCSTGTSTTAGGFFILNA